MKKKIIKLAGIILICMVAITFLYSRMNVDYEQYEEKKEKETKENQSKEEILDFPKTYQKKIDDKLEFDVEVLCVEGIRTKGIPKATASIVSIDQPKTLKHFMGDAEQLKKEAIHNYYDLNDNLVPFTIYTDNYGSDLDLTDKSLYYRKNSLINYINNSFYTGKGAAQYNEYLYSKQSDLSAMSRATAWDTLLEEMETIGLDSTSVNKKVVYSLDVETLQTEEMCIDVYGNEIEEEKNPNWTKKDEGYYYFLGQQFQQVPIYEGKKIGRGIEDIDLSSLCVYQTEDGIAFLNLIRWLSIKEQEGRYSLASFETIMKVVEEKYTGTVKTNPLKVKTAQLYEYPLLEEDQTYRLIPIWICTIEEELISVEGETYFNEFKIPINAVTGEEMIELEE